MIKVFVLQQNILFLTFLLSLHFSILHAENTEILLQNYKEEFQPMNDISCENAYSDSFNYDYNVFCPKATLIFKQIHDASSIKNAPGKLLSEEVTQKRESKNERRVCSFHGSNFKLLASIVSNHRWNFSDTSQHCHPDSLKFSEYDNVSCELDGERDVSMPLRVTPTNITVSFSEPTVCASKSQFLLWVFKLQKGMMCSLKVQQHEINLNVTKNECVESKSSMSCGLYSCSRERYIVDQLREMTRPINFSNTKNKPFSEFWKRNHSDKMKEKTSISDYFFEILLLVFIVILLLICCLTNCLGLNKVLSPSVTGPSYSRRGSLAATAASANEIRTSTLPMPSSTTTLMQNSNNNKLRCSKKPVCVCGSERKGSSSRNTKWGTRGDEESYAPVRQDNASKYVPSVTRG